MTWVRYAAGTWRSSAAVCSRSSRTETVPVVPAVAAPSRSTGSPAGARSGVPVQYGRASSNAPDRTCAVSCRTQARKSMVLAPSTTGAPETAWRYPVSRSSSRIRHDTPSTTRWCAARNSHGRRPGPNRNSAAPNTRAARGSRSARTFSATSGTSSTVDSSWVRNTGSAAGCVTSCSHPSPVAVNRVRSASWWATTAATAVRSAASSTSSATSTSIDMVKCRSGPWVAKNQCWIGLRPVGPSISCAAAGSGTRAPSTTGASSATVWCRKMSLVANGSPARRARDTIWMLRIESPPRPKKLSSTPTRSTPSTSAQISARVRSVPVRGGT